MQEEIQEPRQLTAQEEYCAEQLMTTFLRDETGRFTVSLPKDLTVTIGNSEEYALQRFRALERRFKKQPLMRAAYIKFMEDYEFQGHMKQVNINNI